MTQSQASETLQGWEEEVALQGLNQMKVDEECDTIAETLNLGQDFSNALANLWKHTQTIGGKVVEIGKVILSKIIEFAKANPKAILGTIIGFILGSFASIVPIVGPILKMLCVGLGLAAGAFLDVLGRVSEVTITQALQGASSTVLRFLEILKDVVLALMAK